MSNFDDGKKYGPIRDFLAALQTTTEEKTLSFDQVEQIIGDKLPDSATKYHGGPIKRAGRAPRNGAPLDSKSIRSTSSVGP
jgi:hypothetical protein